MEIIELYSCEKYKVLNVFLPKGEKMPLHHATSDALLICKKGKGRITFSDRIIEIGQGETLLINANEEHKLEVLEDFITCITLENDGQIEFIKPKVSELVLNF
jgi:quercetin dioxygenase-like cupin family protein